MAMTSKSAAKRLRNSVKTNLRNRARKSELKTLEKNFRAAIAAGMKKTTSIVVAQRISSIKHADLILVLDEGTVIGMGNHEHLMATCDVYREISESQMGGAFVE